MLMGIACARSFTEIKTNQQDCHYEMFFVVVVVGCLQFHMNWLNVWAADIGK